VSLAKVVIVEDDAFIRSTLSALLMHKGFDVIGAVETAEEAVLLQQLHKPEVLLTDLDLGPGPNGIDIATALRNRDPNIGIIILTSFSDPRLADIRNQDLPRGTLYFTKSRLSDVSVLFTAILRVKHLPLAPIRRTDSQISNLTDTQIDILRLVSEGQTTSTIAENRGVTEKSVEAALGRIYSALELPRNKSLNPRIQMARAYFTLSGKKPPGE
jgi:two-component system, NarL family, invasion response regulator UvrY